ncbi:MAG: DUF624 domain-containing protein [Defluviitaleaceae bacterium]|nr:DUF624 domain-containing protein [Defluviitaleaceae bacterium]
MRDFFSMDGAFSKYGGLLADTLILSIMWLVFSLPIVTVGAATTAIFYVTTRRIADREGYITRDFWRAFKSNFFRATGLWLLVMAAGFAIWYNISLLTTTLDVAAMGGWAVIMLPMQLVFVVQLVFATIYIFPITARFEMGFVQTIKNSFYMANRHLLTSILCAALLVAVIFISGMTIIFTFAAAGVYAMLSSYLIMRVFKKYRPDMDRDPRAEIAEIEAKMAEEARRKRRAGDSKDI